MNKTFPGVNQQVTCAPSENIKVGIELTDKDASLAMLSP